MQRASGGRKRKESLGAVIDGFVQFKKTQTNKTIKTFEDKMNNFQLTSVSLKLMQCNLLMCRRLML
jgi:hypothetical protein